MNVIKKKAQIRILAHLLDRLCNGELPEAGRKAVRSLIANLNNEINDTIKSENTFTNNRRHVNS